MRPSAPDHHVVEMPVDCCLAMVVSVREIADTEHERRLVGSDLPLRRGDVGVAARVADVAFDVEAEGAGRSRDEGLIWTFPDRVVIRRPRGQACEVGFLKRAGGRERQRRRGGRRRRASIARRGAVADIRRCPPPVERNRRRARQRVVDLVRGPHGGPHTGGKRHEEKQAAQAHDAECQPSALAPRQSCAPDQTGRTPISVNAGPTPTPLHLVPFFCGRELGAEV
jgi:hypothetical protein